ncbi:DUF1801 domain-containing protein [Sphingomonas immobilis]|uniref:DUF1801 domain-containing protein n=1 Tax=Sphingomonas immobilis TaxID=3063997 RepID=A0ABT8ZYI5_9SPHN|nr:DUF1801 domain-containing protein [Sphingomonas sp. CA1-15]MDO7841522.1 DUF1801 domain-containing protein [Sphingomonas sp. CA1-15]
MAAANKTRATAVSVDAFLGGIEPPARIADAHALAALMARVSGERATMWGPAIVGFGVRHYRYDSGHEGSICRVGFSPRAGKFALYLSCDLDAQQPLLDRLGKHKRGKGCLYIKTLADVDAGALEGLVRAGLG